MLPVRAAILVVALALFATIAPVATATFPGSNGRVAYSVRGTQDPPTNYDLVTVKSDGTSLVRLTNDTDIDAAPAWSPDGRRLLFISKPTLADQWQIYLINADGTGKTRLTNLTALRQGPSSPSWSPDGQQVVFVYENAENFWQVYKMRSDGTNVTALTAVHADNFSPKWSPDGTRILFSSFRSDDTNFALYTMRTDGSDVRRIPNTAGARDADWSPDGKSIVFSAGISNLTIVGADGSNPRLIPVSGQAPVWSPDGARIAYQDVQALSYFNVATIRPDGSDLRYLNLDRSGTGARQSSPSWQPLPDQTPLRPSTKDQCKNGGWRNFPGFKNQGDCVSFVATGGKNPPGKTSG